MFRATTRPARNNRDVDARLVDLRKQVAEEEDGGVDVGEVEDEGAQFAGALRVKAVRRLVQDQQPTGAEQGGG